MKKDSNNFGVAGEELARQHLLKMGYQILETNWRFKKYEIDIISKTDETIVFVEVKARKSNLFGEPEIFVTRQKQKFLATAAHAYLVKHQLSLESRFDVISILYKDNKSQINHLKAAFHPEVD